MNTIINLEQQINRRSQTITIMMKIKANKLKDIILTVVHSIKTCNRLILKHFYLNKEVCVSEEKTARVELLRIMSKVKYRYHSYNNKLSLKLTQSNTIPG